MMAESRRKGGFVFLGMGVGRGEMGGIYQWWPRLQPVILLFGS